MAKWATRELMTVEDVRVYLRKPTTAAARKFLKRSGLPLARVGRLLMVDRRDLDRHIGIKTNV